MRAGSPSAPQPSGQAARDTPIRFPCFPESIDRLLPLRRAEVARERDGVRRRDRPARGLGEIRGLDPGQLRRLGS